MTASFTISLDFELRWGVRDNAGSDAYADAIIGGRQAIPLMLAMFEKHGVAATWATVGFLFADNRDMLMDHLPRARPAYANPVFSPYEDVQGRIGRDEAEDPLHFAPSLIGQIAQTPRQEIGSHTFSHFYCREEGGSAEAFGADMQAAQAIAQAQGMTLRSLVLPRNQLSAPHLARARSAGITVFRGNPKAHFYQARPRQAENHAVRALRLIDSMVPLTTTDARPEQDAASGMVDTPASRFLRPISSTTSMMARAQLRRIKGEMTRTARLGSNYHLWWHPHNFGRATEANLGHLGQILAHFQTLQDRYGMQAKTMEELATAVAAPD